MLRVHAKNYIQFGARLMECRAQFAKLRELGDAAPFTERMEVENTKQAISRDISLMRLLCHDLGLPVSEEVLQRRIGDPPQTARELDFLVEGVFAELNTKLFLFVPSYRDRYYEKEDIVSDLVKFGFPSVAGELSNAATCFALDQFTASVFHSMRAAEIGVRALATSLKVELKHSIELTEWGVLQGEIDKKIRDISQKPRTTERDEDQKFYSEAAAQLRYFKDGWRIRVAHARATFNEGQAQTALDHTCAFFETIAQRLKEPELTRPSE